MNKLGEIEGHIEALRKLELDLNFEHVQTDLVPLYEVREFLQTLIAAKRAAQSEASDD